MAGQRTGVATLEPRAVYARCYTHAFNLVASNMLKQCALLEDAISTSHKAIKSHKIIHPEENAFRRIKVSHIRWTIHADALGSIIKNGTVLQSTWDDAKDCRARHVDEGNNSRRYVSNEYVPLHVRDHGGRHY